MVQPVQRHQRYSIAQKKIDEYNSETMFRFHTISEIMESDQGKRILPGIGSSRFELVVSKIN